MVQLTRIYTRGGDKGKTSLASGRRVPKHDLRVTAYGTVDEANAVLGLLLAEDGLVDSERSLLVRVQNDLFDLGADLATPEDPEAEYPPLRITEAQVTWLEQQIDHYNADLEPLKTFVLPGGTKPSAWLHLARTVVRRAERDATRLAEEEPLNMEAVKYVNRLSDLLFVLGRYLNEKGRNDVLWVPGKNR
ncbi:cob(I)yrinic acid a,c-diamide adenosyltransferase [Fodinicurvata sediminis]|uniref:cob(I)yrinic acid a,c-diamide adenosyltransferase n=1 Tax=Fodinicurvata sediminis TaxID=1121832 RepID=UPI0003B4A6AF|nr:cob(I)yrinic acid a,c-diamide adenosyltransferase [Fodinicurvata sediminis]